MTISNDVPHSARRLKRDFQTFTASNTPAPEHALATTVKASAVARAEHVIRRDMKDASPLGIYLSMVGVIQSLNPRFFGSEELSALSHVAATNLEDGEYNPTHEAYTYFNHYIDPAVTEIIQASNNRASNKPNNPHTQIQAIKLLNEYGLFQSANKIINHLIGQESLRLYGSFRKKLLIEQCINIIGLYRLGLEKQADALWKKLPRLDKAQETWVGQYLVMGLAKLGLFSQAKAVIQKLSPSDHRLGLAQIVLSDERLRPIPALELKELIQTLTLEYIYLCAARKQQQHPLHTYFDQENCSEQEANGFEYNLEVNLLGMIRRLSHQEDIFAAKSLCSLAIVQRHMGKESKATQNLQKAFNQITARNYHPLSHNAALALDTLGYVSVEATFLALTEMSQEALVFTSNLLRDFADEVRDEDGTDGILLHQKFDHFLEKNIQTLLKLNRFDDAISASRQFHWHPPLRDLRLCLIQQANHNPSEARKNLDLIVSDYLPQRYTQFLDIAKSMNLQPTWHTLRDLPQYITQLMQRGALFRKFDDINWYFIREVHTLQAEVLLALGDIEAAKSVYHDMKHGLPMSYRINTIPDTKIKMIEQQKLSYKELIKDPQDGPGQIDFSLPTEPPTKKRKLSSGKAVASQPWSERPADTALSLEKLKIGVYGLEAKKLTIKANDLIDLPDALIKPVYDDGYLDR